VGQVLKKRRYRLTLTSLRVEVRGAQTQKREKKVKNFRMENGAEGKGSNTTNEGGKGKTGESLSGI